MLHPHQAGHASVGASRPVDDTGVAPPAQGFKKKANQTLPTATIGAMFDVCCLEHGTLGLSTRNPTSTLHMQLSLYPEEQP